MTIQLMTPELEEDPGPLTGKFVFTYQGAPYPLRLDRLMHSYRVTEVKGKHIFVGPVRDEAPTKTRIAPKSVALICDDLEEHDRVFNEDAEYKTRRGMFVKEGIEKMRSLCTPVQTPTPRARPRPRPR